MSLLTAIVIMAFWVWVTSIFLIITAPWAIARRVSAKLI
jgi:hypothetical protein